MRVLMFAAAMALGLFAVLPMPTPPASASVPCDRDACLWSGDNFTGEAQVAVHTDSAENYCLNLSFPARSVANRVGREVLLSSNPCGSGPTPHEYRYVGNGEDVPSLGFEARSISWCPSC